MPLEYASLLEVKGGEKALEAWPLGIPRPIARAELCLEAADVELPSFTDRVYIGGKEAWLFPFRKMQTSSCGILMPRASAYKSGVAEDIASGNDAKVDQRLPKIRPQHAACYAKL